VFGKKISIIEEAIKGDENLEMFWECVKEGMKREAVADFMEKKPKQVDKLREKLISKIKSSPHFQLG
jgi:RNA binding exosome subunit